LQQLFLAVYTVTYYLQYCKQAFSIASFLQHKLTFALPRVAITSYASGKKQAVTNIPNAELYDTMKRWRDMVCEETKQPIYMVANQNTLKEVCTYLPFTKNDLLQLSGFGKAKVDKYGDDILEIVTSYCSRHNLETNIDAKVDNPKRVRKEKSTDDISTD
jgi:superfamily II DNA helicase RecQ